MTILINTSNLYVGGGLQVALSFLNELKSLHGDKKYHVLMSQAVKSQIDENSFGDNFFFYLIEESPSSLKTRKKVLKELDVLEEKIKPDVVFTVFGPSYWRPKTVHLLGFADGWVYNPNSIAYDKLPFLERMKRKLISKYKSYHLKKDADYFVLETEDAKNKLSDESKIDIDKIFVVGNTYSSAFNEPKLIDPNHEDYIALPKKETGEFRFVYIAHNHPSKNLAIISKILPSLQELNVKFVLTIDSLSCGQMFGDSQQIINLGTVKHTSCPSIYAQCDALFAPTLLETFSAAYPEAMKMQKPILTSNYSFATDICEDAAFYFDPIDPDDVLKKFKTIVKDESLRRELIKKGNLKVKTFETANSRAVKYVSICKNFINKKKV